MIQSQRDIRSGEPTDPARTGLELAGDGRMWLDGRWRPELAQSGLVELQAVMASSEGRCMRALKERENWRLELGAAGAAPRGFYLKKHHVRTWRTRLRAMLGSGPVETAGRTEARNVRRLRGDGIGVMELVAYGETLHGDGWLESFVLTEELEDYAPLDDFLRQRFPRRPYDRAAERDPDLGRLVRQVASVARAFHRAGYNHRDFYCCHFFVKEHSPGRFQIRLIDLQRVQHRRRFRRRWLVKDLAQLAYSAPRERIGQTEKLAFVRHYLGVDKLRACDKRLIRRVLAKQRRMERKRGIPA